MWPPLPASATSWAARLPKTRRPRGSASSARRATPPEKAKGPASRAFLFLGCGEAASGRLFLDHFFGVRRLGTTARALGERCLDLLDRLGLRSEERRVGKECR